MKTFQYQGFDAAGARARGLLEALDAKDARERLARRGILASEVSPAGARAARRAAFDLATRSLVYRELGALLEAGLPMDKALELLVQTPELDAHASRLAGVRDRVREGDSLHAALGAADPRVTAFELSLLQVGESSGRLGPSLQSLAEALEEEGRIRDHVRTVLTYPAIVLFMALAVLVLMSAFLLPAFQRMLDQYQQAPPLLTRVVMAAGSGIRLLGLPVVAVAALGGAAFRRRIAADTGARAAWHRRLCGIPLFGAAYRNLLCLRFARAWSHLLRGGVGIADAFTLAARATGNAWVESLAGPQAETIRSGGAAADAVARIPPLAGSLPGWVRAGEASAGLSALLENAATRHEQAWRREVARKLAWLEPIILLVVAGMVLLLAVAVLLPMLQMNKMVTG